MNNANILVVDDDVSIANAIQKILMYENFNVLTSHDGEKALGIINSENIHLIILDIMMPKLDGLSATLKIREIKNIPIIILSAKSEDSDKVLGLSMGADDYMTKPFSSVELVARVKSQLRRYTQLGNIATYSSYKEIIVGGLLFNSDTKELLVDGETVRLTATELKIFELLISNAGRVFSSEQIYENVWNEKAFAVENTVMVHIRRIREKIEINTKEPKYLKVVWGIGYKIEKY
jgi:DNA-binding response OmpR family regulator